MQKDFLPGVHYHVLTPVYEALARPFASRIWTKIAEDVVTMAPKGGTVVDLGCGPGTVLLLLRAKRPDLTLIGTDIDPAMIAIAERKAQGKDITFIEASADALPLPPASADIVVSSLVFHHLPTEVKRGAFREVKRLLKPGGQLLLCDFARAESSPLPLWLRTLARFEGEALPQLQGQLLELGLDEGMAGITLWTAYGCVSLHLFTCANASTDGTFIV